ncbi:MAG: hypothetical protein AN484_16810 [Aphanizomenon flos-aquae WA102]|jgi:hypothetical protein|uniref:Uncharacterized protein n=1 Tax=Aphanizomenon flos-aquae WA102 TaxID=1710896 RepID=A0A1B7WZP9_APHFL|nr:MAG: hypothetical protein AN484_16810 [Aphanizomenon flos-aquae WA102]
MAAPIGNTNAVKGKMFYDRLRKALTQEPHRLEKIVGQLITQAEMGEAWAVKEIIDRLDGKAVQTNQVENSDGTPLLSGIQVMFVKPQDA